MRQMLSIKIKFILSFWAVVALLGVVCWMFVDVVRTSGSLFTKHSIIAAVAFSLAVLFAWRASTRISRNGSSVEKLTESAARIAGGDFGVKVTIPSQNELKGLANTFNEMSVRLHDSYQRLELEAERDVALLHNMSEGMVATDQAGAVVMINQAAVDLLGLTPDQVIIGTPLSQLAHLAAPDGTAVNEANHPAYIALRTATISEEVLNVEYDGTKRALRVSASPVTVRNTVAGTVILIRDITKEKEVDRMKTEFISIASHQLRTPLSAIKWFSEMLVDGDGGQLTKEQQEFATSIAGSTERMIELVNSLLNISRIESGRIIIEPKPTNLAELVQGIIDDLKGKTAERKQTLTVSVHPDLPIVPIDPHLIGQVYLNLLTNAIKYTPEGGEISVTISRKDNDIISQVSDNGYGIPKAEQDKLFQKFFRATNIVKVVSDGTGLGMYLVKAVIETSGGKIWFKSEEGQGSTFWFSLPVTGMKAKSGEVTLG